jgi:hypothetical protein
MSRCDNKKIYTISGKVINEFLKQIAPFILQLNIFRLIHYILHFKTVTEIGESSMRCFTSSRYFSTRINKSKYLDVSQISGKIQVPPVSLLSIAMKLARTLEILHSCTLGIKLLEKTSIFVGVRSNQVSQDCYMMNLSNPLFVGNFI